MKTIQEAVKAGAVTVADAAKRLGVTRGRVLHLITAGRIRVLYKEPMPGGQPRYWLHKEDVAREADERRRRRIS